MAAGYRRNGGPTLVLKQHKLDTPVNEVPHFVFATHDLRPGSSAAAAGVTFEALNVLEGGAYRLRVRR